MSSTVDLVAESVPDLAQKKPPNRFKSMSLSHKLAYIKQVVTVEPIIIAYMFAFQITGGAFQDLVFEKTCRSNLDYNTTVCQDTLARKQTYPNVITESSIIISNASSWSGLFGAIVPLIVILFLGSYSDRHHIRKPFFIIPLIADLISNLACILSVILMREISLEVLFVLIFIVPSMMGSQVMLTMALFSYIADISTVEMRTLRIGILQIAIQITSTVSQALNGITFVTLGYIGTLSIAVGCDVFAILYAYFVVKEPKKKVEETDGRETEAKKGLIADIFDTKHVMETLNVLLKKAKGNDRLLMLLIIVILIVINITLAGESSLYNIYVFNAFNWDALDKSYFNTTTTIVHLIGTFIAISVFSVMWKFSDFTLLAIGFSTEILGRLVIGFTTTATLYYVGSICTVFNGAIGISLRSMSSKVVSEADIGKAQSLMSIFESIGSAIANPIYDSGIYNHTIKVMASAFYLFSAILQGGCLLITLKQTYPNVITESSIIISNASSWSGLFGSIVPLIVILFLGSYSDRHHIRKPFFIIPLIADLIANLACILSVIFMKEISLEVSFVLIFIIPPMIGSQVMLTMALFSYIADISTVEMRTLRIGILQIAIQITSIVSQALNGITFVTLGYIGTLSIAVGCDVFAILYAYFVVKEPKKKVEETDGREAEAKKGLIADIFDTKNVMETLNVLLKKANGNDRLLMWLIIVILIVINVALIGESSLYNIYVFNAFNWDALDKSYFNTTTSIVQLIGTFITMSVFSVMWKFSDFTLLAIGLSTEILGRLVIGFTTTATLYYVGSICMVFNGALLISLTSISSKVVSEADIGKAQSLVSIVEGIGSAIASPIYDSGIYNHTIKVMASAFYLFSAILLGGCLLITFWMFFHQKQRDQKAAEAENKNKALAVDDYKGTEMSRL